MPAAVLDGLLSQAAEDADLVLIEASMGLFDGAGPPGQAGRAADLAARWGLPVLLVLDVSGQSQTAAATEAQTTHFSPASTSGAPTDQANVTAPWRCVARYPARPRTCIMLPVFANTRPAASVPAMPSIVPRAPPTGNESSTKS